MGFWDSAVDQAGRNFGDRYWRWFAGVRVARRVLPPVFAALLFAGVGYAAYAAYRWLSPDWSTIGSSVGGGTMDVGRWLLIALGVAVAVGLLVVSGRWMWRLHSWRWSWRWSRF